jgi:hypothetical protein
MNVRITIAAVVMLGLIAAAVYFLDLRRPEEPSAASAPSAAGQDLAIFQTDAQAITEIDVRRGERTIVATKDASGAWAADAAGGSKSTAVEDLAFRLATLRAIRRLDDAADLAAYGLDTPEMTVVFKEATATHTLLLGDTTPVGSGVYARAGEGPTIYVVSSDLKRALDSLFDTSSAGDSQSGQ